MNDEILGTYACSKTPITQLHSPQSLKQLSLHTPMGREKSETEWWVDQRDRERERDRERGEGEGDRKNGRGERWKMGE